MKPAKERAYQKYAGKAGAGFGGFSTSSASNLSYLTEFSDYGSISDPNVVIAFKNIQKRDTATRQRGVEDLLAYAIAHPHDKDGGVEDAVLEAWAQVYPRAAIDNSRRIREVAHNIQLQLMNSARKRAQKQIPLIVGTWLAGTFDRDKGVARAASDGLATVFTSHDKITQFWKKCQTQILQYAVDALGETAGSLSDERTESPDECETKYHRVISYSRSLVLGLLEKLEGSERESCDDLYREFFENENVWAGVTTNDAAVRRQTSHLLSVCVEKRLDQIQADSKLVSKHFIAEGLKSSQTGSATDFVTALVKLTQKLPTVWTTDYKSKKSVISRLKAFLEQGSQGAGSAYWAALSSLLAILPPGVLPTDVEGVSAILDALRKGVCSELRTNAIEAWTCYMSVAKQFLYALETDAARLDMVEKHVFPIFEAYLYPTPERSTWVSGSLPLILIKAYTLTTTSSYDSLLDATKQAWARLANIFHQNLRNSSPEASKDHTSSQQQIAGEGDRWFSLVSNLLVAHARTAASERPIPDIVSELSLGLVLDSLKVLQNRNWKTFGAAATLESAIKSAPQLLASSLPAVSEILDTLKHALTTELGALLQTQSAPYMFSSLRALGEAGVRQKEFGDIWTATIHALLQEENKNSVVSGLVTLLSTKNAVPLAQSIETLQKELVDRSLKCAIGEFDGGWPLLQAVVTSGAISDDAAQALVKELASQITDASGSANSGVVKALNIIAKKNSALLLQDEKTHMTMMTALLSLSERTDSYTEATELHERLQGGKSSNTRVVSLVQNSINTIGPDSLAISTLVQQALLLCQSTEEDEITYLLPDLAVWKQELSNILQTRPDPSLALTSSLAGAYFLAASDSSNQANQVRRDQTGCSIPGRMALYTAKLFSSSASMKTKLGPEAQSEILMLLGTTAEVVADQTTVSGKNSIWASVASYAVQEEANDLVSTVRKILMGITEDAAEWRDGTGSPQSQVMSQLVSRLIDATHTLNAVALYSTKLLSEIFAFLTETHGLPSDAEEWIAGSDLLKASPTSALGAAAILSGMGQSLASSKAVNTFCNRLVSEIAGAKISQDKALITLVLFNICAEVYPAGELPVANNRLVFAVRQITSWLDTPEKLDVHYAAEVCRALRHLLPCVKDVYGAYWAKSIDFCLELWSKNSFEPLNDRLPAIHTSMRLMSTLEALEEPNDDLVDVLETTQERRSTALTTLLQAPRGEHTQPLEIVDAMICRRSANIPLAHVKDISDFYGLLASESRTLQTAAFALLHRALPAFQENLAVDILVEKKTARLPDELLSLLLEAPTLDAYSDEMLAQFPTAIRSYLLTWHVIFDTFEAVPHKMREDYAEHLKQANYIGPLMRFTFDVLGHSAAHALNLDQAGFTSEHIRHYNLQVADSEDEERNLQWLLIHLFFCTLKYLPGLFKAWFKDCTSKQTTIAVEAWLVKYFSPLVIADTLDAVETWAANQDPPSNDEQELIVKVSRNTKDLYVGYPVDDTEASITIRLPGNFPLDNVTASTVHRAAASEKKWNCWLLATQGIIAFTNGGVIDGVTAFRRNIVSAMAGYTECAICYSFIGTDKGVPDKKCKTCKNPFHRTCLFKWFASSNNNTCPLCRTAFESVDLNKSKGNGWR
ncbi:E3 ubiquitin-protein ligase listerin [Microdochium nivale]|nr:E3 ubiquitin-protein ligase listerin [Microdochium nivale]